MREKLVLAAIVLLASVQVTLRSDDPSGVARALTQNILSRSGGDLAQYRPLSQFVIVALQWVEGISPESLTPYLQMRFVQCLLIFGLAYVYYRELGLAPRTRLLGICLLAGIMSLSLGPQGASTFSLDRFTDTIFFLVAAMLTLHDRIVLIPPLMLLAVANRETSVFMPTLILARYGFNRRGPLLTALAAWIIGAIVYFGIHAYYGPQPRTEESYFGPDMFLHSLSMPAQVAYFFAAVTLLPLIALLSLSRAQPFLRRLFWLVVPLWFSIHIWAARLGEGMLFLAPITLILVPLCLEYVERRLTEQPVRRLAT